MQKFTILIFFATVGFCAAAYSHKYSYINLHDVLHNTRLLKRYIDCLLDVPQTCTKDGDYLREILPEAIDENCAKCDANQKENALKVIAYLMKHHDDWWSLIDRKYNANRSLFSTEYNFLFFTIPKNLTRPKRYIKLLEYFNQVLNIEEDEENLEDEKKMKPMYECH
ncbi:unnamed protein product [Diabrotica balteata]|uniref:Uncharacterized protein n=1 Tax=Diabrotica balteata TaxID=107213 RepID=A0A9N9TAJ4_DIABA|nr:unnamed protein product [Diabrotica balteata]